MVDIDRVTDDAQFGPFVLGSEFAGRQKFDVRGPTRLPHALTTLHRVVIRKRHTRKSMARGMTRQLLRRVRPVGERRVQMEIGKLHETILAGRIKSPLTLSRIPLTNLPLSSVENRFAISTASLMLPTGEISSRKSIS